MPQYIGLDSHATSSTFGVIDQKGKRLKHEVVETSARYLIDFVTTVPRPRYLCLEEGTQSTEERQRWNAINDKWSYFEFDWKPKKWENKYRLLCLRQRRTEQQKGPLQLACSSRRILRTTTRW